MQNILKDIHQYKPQITIRQVVTFFERKGINITRNMVQNYVRDGILPPPINKRYYSHKHLAALALIGTLKNIYELSEIKTVLAPFMDREGIDLELYYECVERTSEIARPTVSDPLLLMAYSVDVMEEARISLAASTKNI